MYTSLLYSLIKGNNAEKLATLIESDIIPSFKKQRGWEGWRLVINQDNNKLALLTYWSTKEDVINVGKSGIIKEQLSKIFPFMTTKPNLKFFSF